MSRISAARPFDFSGADIVFAHQPVPSSEAVRVPLGPLPKSAPAVTGLKAPRAISATQPRASKDDEAGLVSEARSNFQDQRADALDEIKQHCPQLNDAAANALADEWVGRSVARYRSFLRGYNDGIEALTVPNLLATIAYEGTRPASDPIRATADDLVVKQIQKMVGQGLTEKAATFQLHTVGARLSRSTADWAPN